MLRMPPAARALLFTAAAASLAAGLFAQDTATRPADRSAAAGNYDARVTGRRGLQALLAEPLAAPLKAAPSRGELAARAKAMRRALERLRAAAPGATARFSPVTAAPELVSGERGPLSAPAAGPGIDVVRGFLRAHLDLYGLSAADVEALRFLGESVSPRSGLRMVRVEQRLNGLPVFESETRFLLDREGRVWRSLGRLVPAGAAAPPPARPEVSAERALARALGSVGAEPAGAAAGSELVYFPAAPGRLVLAWRQLAFAGDGGDWATLVDAATGALLWRKDLREHLSGEEARFSVYVQADGVTPADSPAPASPTTAPPGSSLQYPEIARTVVAMSAAQDLAASPEGWIPDGGSTTTGNNVDACVDRIVTPVATERNVCDRGTLDDDGRPVGNPDAAGRNRDFLGTSPRDYGYAPAPVGGDPDAGDEPTGDGPQQTRFRRGSVTQAFYVANWYHDRLFNLGFDEAAGNFQRTNYSGEGAGGDPLRVDVQDGQGQNVPFFTTPPDGASGRLTLHRFIEPVPNRDSALDANIILHELTHGTTNRIIGNAGGLLWGVGRALGEGWSDFYALALLNDTDADDPDASYTYASYANYQRNHFTQNYVYGQRRFPYSTDNAVNPLTWGDTDDTTADPSGGIDPSPLGGSINGALDALNAGELWALSLWELRSRIIADPAGAAGDVPTGNRTALQLVTDALKMTPANPSFVDARDALLLADCATNGCANERSIWAAFADRGLGYGAVAPLGQAGFFNVGHLGLGESFALPHLDAGAPRVDEVLGNHDGAIDPGETVRLTVPLVNPWRGPAFAVRKARATLTSATPGVTVLDGVANYRALPGRDLAPVDGFLLRLDAGAACGRSLRLALTIDSALGAAPAELTLRVGARAGTGAPVTYTRTIPAGLPIPDGDRRGVADSLTVADDFEIADLDFRVDDLRHPFTGDLTVLLRAPNGYGADLIWQRGAGVLGSGEGADFIGTVIDDQATNDLNQSVETDAPFTGSWAPAFNSEVWRLFGTASIFPDPVGQLARLNGTSTAGEWKVLVADVFGPEAGTLNSWSLIVTPAAFTCEVFSPGRH